jgi:hypothetical protein
MSNGFYIQILNIFFIQIGITARQLNVKIEDFLKLLSNFNFFNSDNFNYDDYKLRIQTDAFDIISELLQI